MSNTENENNNSRGAKNVLFNLSNKFKNLFNQKEYQKNNSKDESISNFVIPKIKIHEATNVLNECIPHFSNFKFAVSEAIDIIVELGSKYKNI